MTEKDELLNSQKVSSSTNETFRDDYIILGTLSKLLFTALIIFGIYIHFHGDIRPGGGFQSGVMFALAIVSHDMLQYHNHYQNLFLEKINVKYFFSIGLIAFFMLIFLPLLNNSNPFDYQAIFSFLFKNNLSLCNELGIFIFEFAICMIVFSSFFVIFKSIFLILKRSNIFN